MMLTADIPCGGAPAGSKLGWVPRHSGGLSLDYDARDDQDNGWRYGGRIHAVSSTYVDATNLYRIGGHAPIDASTSYTRDGLSVGFYVKKLTDRDYFTPYHRFWTGGLPVASGGKSCSACQRHTIWGVLRARWGQRGRALRTLSLVCHGPIKMAFGRSVLNPRRANISS